MLIPNSLAQEEVQLPDWIKNVAGWWSNDMISENEFLNAIEYLVNNNDTIDIFSYQIPSNYNQNNSHPLLVAFHQWGGNQNSTYSTNFDEEANNRGWFFLSPFGGAENNYNNQVQTKVTVIQN